MRGGHFNSTIFTGVRLSQLDTAPSRDGVQATPPPEDGLWDCATRRYNSSPSALVHRYELRLHFLLGYHRPLSLVNAACSMSLDPPPLYALYSNYTTGKACSKHSVLLWVQIIQLFMYLMWHMQNSLCPLSRARNKSRSVVKTPQHSRVKTFWLCSTLICSLLSCHGASCSLGPSCPLQAGVSAGLHLA